MSHFMLSILSISTTCNLVLSLVTSTSLSTVPCRQQHTYFTISDGVSNRGLVISKKTVWFYQLSGEDRGGVLSCRVCPFLSHPPCWGNHCLQMLVMMPSVQGEGWFTRWLYSVSVTLSSLHFLFFLSSHWFASLLLQLLKPCSIFLLFYTCHPGGIWRGRGHSFTSD